jgi:hypothetical protein
MAVATFDTLKFAKAPKPAGMPEGQVDAHVDALADLSEQNVKDLASKDDLKEVSNVLKNDIKELRSELKADIKDLRHDMMQLGTTLTAKLELQEQRLRTEQYILRWMLGGAFSLLLPIAICLLFFRTGI